MNSSIRYAKIASLLVTFTIYQVSLLKGCPIMHCNRSVCVHVCQWYFTFQSHIDAFPSLPLIPDNFGSIDRCCPVHRWLRVRAARPQAHPGTPHWLLLLLRGRGPHIPAIRSAGLQQRSVPDWNGLIGIDGLLFKGMPVNYQIWSSEGVLSQYNALLAGLDSK